MDKRRTKLKESASGGANNVETKTKLNKPYKGIVGIQALAKEFVTLKVQKTSEKYILQKEGFNFKVTITPEYIGILNSDSEKEFIFQSANSPQTIRRWEMVVEMLSEAVKLLKSKRGLK